MASILSALHTMSSAAILLLLVLSSHTVHLCSGAATWSVNVATGFTSVDYSVPLSTVNNAQDANWMVEPPGSSAPQPARVTWPGGGNWPGTAWLDNGPLSAWISVSANDYHLGAGGPYNFTRSFNVPSAVTASSVVFNGAISCDNDCNVLFNGVRVGPYYTSTFDYLRPLTLQLGSMIKVGQVNVLRINLTDYGTNNAVRIQGTITGTLANYWSVNVATGWTSSDYSGALSTTNAAKDAHWSVMRSGWSQSQAAEICTPNGGNWPTPIDPWVPNGPISDWIAVGCTSYTQGSGGPYDFLYTFMLPANLDPLSITFVGAITCDDDCNVLVNNNVIGPHYTQAYTALRYFNYDYSAGWIVGGMNTITLNLTDTGSYNGVRLEGSIQARVRSSSSSTGRFMTSSSSRRCPYWASGTYYPRCFCPYEGTFPYCECPAPYKGDIPYDCYNLFPDPNNPDSWPVSSTGTATGSSSGLSTTVIVIIIVAVVLIAAVGGYLYWKHFRQPSAAVAGGQDNWHDKANLLPGQTNSNLHNHLGVPASATSQPQTQQGGLDYYMTAPGNGQPGGQRGGVELH